MTWSQPFQATDSFASALALTGPVAFLLPLGDKNRYTDRAGRMGEFARRTMPRDLELAALTLWQLIRSRRNQVAGPATRYGENKSV